MTDGTARARRAGRRGSELDRMIARLQTQKLYLERAAAELEGVAGTVLEVGLGKGRTFDHLRHLFQDRRIVAFDRDMHALQHCAPDRTNIVLGEFKDTLPAWLAETDEPIALIHADFGSRDAAQDAHVASELRDCLEGKIRTRGWLVCDRPLTLHGMSEVDMQVSPGAWQYHAYRAD